MHNINRRLKFKYYTT